MTRLLDSSYPPRPSTPPPPPPPNTCFLFVVYVVYKEMSEAVRKHPEVDVLVNFASLRSAYEATVEAMSFDKVGVVGLKSRCGLGVVGMA